MIDIENYITDELSQVFEGIAEVSSVFVEERDTYPWVYVRKISSPTVKRYSDDSLYEHAVNMTIRIEYFSALTAGAKQEVKDLMQMGDEYMQSIKFTRAADGLVPNYDRTVTRGYADYTAIVWEPKDVNGNTVFQIYRR